MVEWVDKFTLLYHLSSIKLSTSFHSITKSLLQKTRIMTSNVHVPAKPNPRPLGSKPPPKETPPKDEAAEALEALKKLETKTKAVNANNIARVANSQLVSADDKLHPLLALKTGKAIEKFPSTPKEINKLGVVQLDSMLLALEADRSGKEEEKSERLRVQIGLKPNPAWDVSGTVDHAYDFPDFALFWFVKGIQ